jgi:sec-independent protein translocase protein TatA
MGLFTPVHLFLVFLVLLFFFGAKRLPELGRSIGEGIRGVRAAFRDEDRSVSQNSVRREK